MPLIFQDFNPIFIDFTSGVVNEQSIALYFLLPCFDFFHSLCCLVPLKKAYKKGHCMFFKGRPIPSKHSLPLWFFLSLRKMSPLYHLFLHLACTRSPITSSLLSPSPCYHQTPSSLTYIPPISQLSILERSLQHTSLQPYY